MYIKNTKRDKIDTCNICLEKRLLTWDHIPPQALGNHKAVEIASLFSKIKGDDQVDRPLISQNGVKYRTICGPCNSMIGSKYDPALIQFVSDVLMIVNTKLSLPPIVTLTVRPLPVAKAIMGHILASKKVVSNSGDEDIYRQFVLDEAMSFNKSINIFYWVYPYERTIIMRDFYMGIRRGDLKESAIFHLLKFFPLGFLVTETADYEGLARLSDSNGTIFIDTEINIPVRLKENRSILWPATVDQGNIIFTSDETENAVIAATRSSIKV